MSRPTQTPQRSESRPRRHTRIAGVVAAALVISWGGPAANAFWQTLSSNAGAAKADSIPAVAAPTASGSAGAASVSWSQGATVAGRPVSGYTVARYSSATGGTKVAAGGACSGTVTTLSCTEAALPAGTWYYSVTPVLASWTGRESARSAGVTIAVAAPPAAPTVSAPAIVKIGNAANVTVSVTAESGSSVSITVTDAPPAGTQQQTSTQTLTANGSAQSTTFNLSAFKDGTITYTAVATNAAGSASAPTTATSMKDTVAPSVTGVTLANGVGNNGKVEAGDKVTIKFSEALDASSICSAWDNTASGQTVSGPGVVVAINSTNSLSVSVASGCPTLRFGSLALGGSYYGSGSLQFSNSSLAWDKSNLLLTVTLGSLSNGGSAGNATQQNGTPVYSPQSGLTDIAGNSLPTTQISGTPASRF